MLNILLVIDVLIAIGLIALILLQRGPGATAGAAFGSGASGTVFGARGSANFLSRSTGVLAAAFFLVTLGMAMVASRQVEEGSATDNLGVMSALTPAAEVSVDTAPALNADGEVPSIGADSVISADSAAADGDTVGNGAGDSEIPMMAPAETMAADASEVMENNSETGTMEPAMSEESGAAADDSGDDNS